MTRSAVDRAKLAALEARAESVISKYSIENSPLTKVESGPFKLEKRSKSTVKNINQKMLEDDRLV